MEANKDAFGTRLSMEVCELEWIWTSTILSSSEVQYQIVSTATQVLQKLPTYWLWLDNFVHNTLYPRLSLDRHREHTWDVEFRNEHRTYVRSWKDGVVIVTEV